MNSGESERLNWDLATERIVVKIRWFGIVMGFLLVESRVGLHNKGAVQVCLELGALYTLLDTIYYRRGTVFLRRWPLFVSLMEAVFIALLCDNDTQLTSPFRWYYLLSILCCALRYRPVIAWTTCAFHCASFAALTSVVGIDRVGLTSIGEIVVILVCVTWTSSSLSSVVHAAGTRLKRANADLERNRSELEQRVAERTQALRASQARVIHQEKMAAFGLLSAGIAHEVGNPLAGISSLMQMIRRKNADPYTNDKLQLAERQLGRIQRTIRELVDFSRPASTTRSRVRIAEVVEEALGIAKYYQRTKERAISTEIPTDLPPVKGVRDHMTQVILNLVLNAIDATEREGRISLVGLNVEGHVQLRIEDDGRGVSPADTDRLFQPYFTTKPSGTGLGLFVSRQIIEEMGGRLTFEPSPGGGATFVIELPGDRPEHATHPTQLSNLVGASEEVVTS